MERLAPLLFMIVQKTDAIIDRGSIFIVEIQKSIQDVCAIPAGAKDDYFLLRKVVCLFQFCEITERSVLAIWSRSVSLICG